MGLREILSNEDMKAADKLQSISEIIGKAREAYGNTEAKIAKPKVTTTEGEVDISILTVNDKLALAEREITQAAIKVSETCEDTAGSVFDKELERVLATNAILVNLTASTGSSYL